MITLKWLVLAKTGVYDYIRSPSFILAIVYNYRIFTCLVRESSTRARITYYFRYFISIVTAP